MQRSLFPVGRPAVARVADSNAQLMDARAANSALAAENLGIRSKSKPKGARYESDEAAQPARDRVCHRRNLVPEKSIFDWAWQPRTSIFS